MNRESLVALTMALALVQGAYAETLSGAWKLMVKRADAPEVNTVKGMAMTRQKDGRLLVTDPRWDVTKVGKAEGKNVTIPVSLVLPGAVSAKEFSLQGKEEKGVLAGNFVSGDVRFQWEATRLPSHWCCSNHKDPRHVVTSGEDMKAYTKEKGCKGWYPVDRAWESGPDEAKGGDK